MKTPILAFLTIATAAGLTASSAQVPTPSPSPATAEAPAPQAQPSVTPNAEATPAPLTTPTPAPTPAATPTPDDPSADLPPMKILAGYATPPPPAPVPEGFAARVVRPKLDPDLPVTVKISVEEDTLLTFPRPIEALYGNKFARKAEERTVSKFVLSYSNGKAYCALRALHPDVTGTLSVVLDGRPYVIVCQTVPETDRDFSVIFNESGSLPNGEPPKPPTDTAPKLSQFKPASPGRINGLLDKMKAYPSFREANPLMFAGLDVAEPHKDVLIPGVRAEIRRVIRDNSIDTLAFEVGLTNTTGAAYLYDPESFNVRVGAEVYHESFADASGRIPPGQTTTAYFTVTGSQDGSRNDLAVNNDFTLAFSKVIGAPAVATTTTTTTRTTTKRTPDRSK